MIKAEWIKKVMAEEMGVLEGFEAVNDSLSAAYYRGRISAYKFALGTDYEAQEPPTETQERCPDCRGDGFYVDGPQTDPEQVQCERCGGTGKVPVTKSKEGRGE